MKNYFEILNVSENAEVEIIKASYKALAKKYHPDSGNIDKAVSEEKMKEINEAYNVLMDEKLKQQHLRNLQAEKKTNTTYNKNYGDTIYHDNNVNKTENKNNTTIESYDIKPSEIVIGCLGSLIIMVLLIMVLIFISNKIGLTDMILEFLIDIKKNVMEIFNNFKK